MILHRKTLHFLLAAAFALLLSACQEKTVDMAVAAKDQAAGLERLIARGDAPLYRCDVIRVYRHDPEAYTQGLLIRDGFLYESTGLKKRSTLRQVDLESGRIIRSVALPDHLFAEGLTLLDGKFFQLTWKAGTARIYDQVTLEQTGEFTYETEGWGLTNDGSSLIMGDGSSRLYFLDPDTFRPIRQITVQAGREPVSFLNELEYIEGEIFASIFMSDYIARIDPVSGRVTGWIDARRLRHENGNGPRAGALNGIAFDPDTKRIFLTGKRWTKLFEVQFAEASPFRQ
jgi:glutamine cyclotransferase